MLSQMKLIIFPVFYNKVLPNTLKNGAPWAKKWCPMLFQQYLLPCYFDLCFWWRQFSSFNFTALFHSQSVAQVTPSLKL